MIDVLAIVKIVLDKGTRVGQLRAASEHAALALRRER